VLTVFNFSMVVDLTIGINGRYTVHMIREGWS
jgi:hypothetical protein